MAASRNQHYDQQIEAAQSEKNSALEEPSDEAEEVKNVKK